MSTRAHITIKQGENLLHMSHHCDGYPDGVGSDLVSFLKSYKEKKWEAEKLREYINDQDDEYRYTDNGLQWDQEYLYVIDCDEKTLSAYHTGINSSKEDLSDYNCGYGDKLFIADNIFDGRRSKEDECLEAAGRILKEHYKKEKKSFLFSSSPCGAPREKSASVYLIDWDVYKTEVAKEIFPVFLKEMGSTNEPEEIIPKVIDATEKFIEELKKTW